MKLKSVLVILAVSPAVTCTTNVTGSRVDNVTVVVEGGGDGFGRVEDNAGVAGFRIDCRVETGVATSFNCEDSFFDVGGGGTFDLLAVPDSPENASLFGGWSGDCISSGTRCTLSFTEQSLPASFLVRASFLRIPDEIQVQLIEGVLETGGTTQATAASAPALPQAEYTWSSSDPSVASVAPGSPTSSAVVVGVGPGTAEITATSRTRESAPVTVTVGEVPVDGTYRRSLWATVEGAISIDFDSQGNAFVGNTGVSGGGAAGEARIRKVTVAGEVSDFGNPVADPDALMVDRVGEISSLGANAVLAAGAYDSQYSNNHVTEISADGTTQQPLVERAPPALSNPSALALLPSGDLLVGSYGNNTVTRVFRNAQNGVEVVPFFQDLGATSALTSLAVLESTVYVVTGSHRVAALDANGEVLHADVWPQTLSADPSLVSADLEGSYFGSGLVAGSSDGRLLLMNPATLEWTRIGTFRFDAPLYGLGISPADGLLYVIDAQGQIWKVDKP